MSLGDFSLDISAIGKKEILPDPDTVYDLLIAGGGPAAMTAAVYAARKMMKLAILAYEFGGQMSATSWIENYMGFQAITGQELVEKFQEQVEQFKIPILTGHKIQGVKKKKDVFRAELDDGRIFSGRTFILSTGKRDRKLGVPGEEKLIGKGVAYCATCDAPFFKDKKVLVAGGGNSAFTAALDLLKMASEVTMVNFAQGWQADEILYNTVTKSGKARLLDNTQVVRIDGETRVESIRIQDRETGEQTDIPADGIFIEIGLIPNSEPVEGLLELNAHKEVVVDCNTRTTLPGFFGAGDVTTVPYKQIVISSGEGAKAALAAYDYLTQRGLL